MSFKYWFRSVKVCFDDRKKSVCREEREKDLISRTPAYEAKQIEFWNLIFHHSSDLRHFCVPGKSEAAESFYFANRFFWCKSKASKILNINGFYRILVLVEETPNPGNATCIFWSLYRNKKRFERLLTKKKLSFKMEKSKADTQL